MKRIYLAALVFSILSSHAIAENNVVLVTIDALRADHLPPYGYDEVETPAISALASDGITFGKTVVQNPLSTPSHASILTGTYPQYHGLQAVGDSIGEDLPTLAEWFNDRGYATAAFVGSGLLFSQWGLNRGFQTYDDHFSTSTTRPTDFAGVRRSAEEVIESALRWLGRTGSKPIFLWLNFSDLNAPLAPPAPYSIEYASSPYDGEVAYIDSMLSVLFQKLKEKDLYQSSLVVLTAPHGAALGEHEEDSNGLFLYHSTLQVPFILKLADGMSSISDTQAGSPRQLSAVRVDRQARSVDLAPTLIQLSGGSAPESMQGMSLVEFLESPEQGPDLGAYSETHYPQLRFGWSSLFSYCSGRYKLIEAPTPELYDLETDPAELKNLYGERKELAEKLQGELEQFRSRFPAGNPQITTEAAGVDPKTRIDLYRSIDGATSKLQNGLSTEALTAIREVLLKEPGNPAAHFVLGSHYLEEGKYLLAIQEFRESLERTPLSYEIRMNLALAYLRAGINGQAQTILSELLEKNPADTIARQSMAISCAKQGNFEQAIAHGQRAVQLRPLSASAHYNLGSYYLASGNDAEAAECFKRVIEISPAHIGGRTNLSFVLLRLGQVDEALLQADEIVKLLPDNSRGHFYRGQAYLAKGMKAEAEAAFRKAKELNPQMTVPDLNR